MLDAALQHDAFAEVDPDKDRFFKAGKGCVSNDPKLQVHFGWKRKVSTAIQGFLQCANLVRAATSTPTATKDSLRVFTMASMASSEVIAAACPGTANMCNATFCNALVQNMTTFKKPFCDSIPNVLAYYAYCGQQFVYPINPPTTDVTCGSSETMQLWLLEKQTSSWSLVHSAVFLGCAGLEDLQKKALFSYSGTLSNYVEAAKAMGTFGSAFFPGAFNAGQVLQGTGVMSMVVGVVVGIVVVGGW
jgi:hypothetical protein